MTKFRKDHHIAATDLLVAIVCAFCMNHAKSGKFISVSLSESDYPVYAYFLIAAASFLGFIHWGFLPHNTQLQRVYSAVVSASRIISIPYLLFILIEQSVIPPMFVFASLVGAFITLYTVFSTAQRVKYEQQVSLVLTLAALIPMVGQAVLSQDVIRIGVGLCFGAIAGVGKNYALLHYILSVALYLIESGRAGHFIKLF